MRIIKIKYSQCPVPLNERLTVVPIDSQAGGLFVSGCRRAGGSKRRVTHVMRLTYKYSQWLKKETAILAFTKKDAGIRLFNSNCVALLFFTPPDNGRRHDADGILKGPFDVLTRAQIVKDDSQIKDFTVVQTKPKDKGGLILYLCGEYECSDLEALQYLTKTVIDNLKETNQNE